MKSIMVTVLCTVLLQRCGNDTKPACYCDKTEYVLDFTNREGTIALAENGSWRSWIILTQDGSQIFTGVICNLNAALVQDMLSQVSSVPNSTTSVVFSGRVTQLCPNETRPVAPSNNSFFYIKLTDIKLK